MMKCEEMLKLLGEYVDGEIEPEICRQFEEHLADCQPCKVVIDNIRQTIAIYRAGEPYPLPAELCQRLRQRLRDRWQLKYGCQRDAEDA